MHDDGMLYAEARKNGRYSRNAQKWPRLHYVLYILMHMVSATHHIGI